jgi:crotonobetainyl-CoA:carnitine CoA-transferase CaiB-like acyl-CoA transferase
MAGPLAHHQGRRSLLALWSQRAFLHQQAAAAAATGSVGVALRASLSTASPTDDDATEQPNNKGPLSGYKVLDLTQVVAGNVASSILAHFGADVIKLEPPKGGGDPIRGLRDLDSAKTSYWWRSLGRNRRCATADLRTEAGRLVARRLALEWPCDVLVENFRPGVVEGHGLGPSDLPSSVVFARISGYGQTGPKASHPGYASVCEAGAGLRHLNGYEGQVPVRLNASLGDTLTGIYAALGTAMALLHRERTAMAAGGGGGAGGGGVGQVVDASIHESVASILDAVVTEAAAHRATSGQRGSVRGPSGSTISGVVPTGTFRTRDGRFAVIGGNGESVYGRLMRAVGREDMAGDVDERYRGNANRIGRETEIMAAISEWVARHDLSEVIAAMREARVPAGPLATPEDLLDCPQYNARGFLERARRPPKDGGGKEQQHGDEGDEGDEEEEEYVLHAWPPFLSKTPGGTRWAGADLGQHTDEVLRGILGMDVEEIEKMRKEGAV